MSELTSNVEVLLGRRISLSQSSLYELLGLVELESDSKKIEVALSKTISHLRQAKAGADREAWDAVVPLVQQAKSTLLDPVKKEAYDLLLREQGKWINFPSADPREPFDMAAYVRDFGTGNDQEATLEDRLEALKKELNLPSLGWEIDSPNKLGAAAVADLATPVETRMDSGNGSFVLEKPESIRTSSGKAIGRSRKQTGSSTRLLGTGLVLASLLFVGFGVWSLVMNQAPKKKSNVVSRDGAEQPANARSNPLANSPTGGSNKKAPTTFDVEATKFEVGAAKWDVLDESKAIGSMEAKPSTSEMTTPPDSIPVPTANPTPSPPVKDDPKPPMKEAVGPLTVEERQKLVESLKACRKAIDDWDFERFEMEIAASLPLAREAPYQDQHARLDQLGQLKKIFYEAILAGVGKLTGGDSIKVMNSTVAYVEKVDEFIILKIGGESVKHSIKNLPLGIGLGIADLTLDSEAGTDVAARGVFCLLLPRQSSVSDREGKKFLEKAIKTGKVRADLMTVFQDKYE